MGKALQSVSTVVVHKYDEKKSGMNNFFGSGFKEEWPDGDHHLFGFEGRLRNDDVSSKRRLSEADLGKINMISRPSDKVNRIGYRSFKEECSNVKAKTKKLADLLSQMVAVNGTSVCYKRPIHQIIRETENVLILCKWQPTSFRGIIWLLINWLYDCSSGRKLFGANLLLLLFEESEMLRKQFINEGGVVPLLKLLQEGGIRDHEVPAKAIRILGSDKESLKQMIDADVYLLFANVLKQGSMKVQVEVAWIVSEHTTNYPDCQDRFSQHNIIQLLINHIAFETVQNVEIFLLSTRPHLFLQL